MLGLWVHCFCFMNTILKAIVLLTLFSSCEQPNSSSSFTMKEPVFTSQGLTAPRPEKKPITLTAPNGDQRLDEYYWLNERENPAVVAYLEAENKYAETILAPVANLRNTLFEEMRSRIKEDDNSVPYYNKGYWYYTRYETGKEYPIFCRKKETLEAPEIILLDVNQLAAGKAYCSVTGLNVSPNNQLLYYAVDYTGRNLYQGRILNLETGALLPEVLESAFGASIWSKDNQFLFYDTKDAQTLRTDKVWRHQLGTPTEKDALVFHETDETTYASLSGSKDGEYAFINHGYTQNLETHFLQLDQPLGSFQVIEPRQKDFFYEVEHHKGQFIVRSNLQGRNFSLFTTPVDQPGKTNWKPLLPYQADALVESVDIFDAFMAINERRGGLQQIRVYQWADGSTHDIDFGEPTYDAATVQLANYESKEIRFVFSSLKTPVSIFDYEVATKTKQLKKVEPVLGGYDPTLYQTAFIWAPARDGAKVPVSLVYKKTTALDGTAPCYQIGYGAYGVSYDPGFNKSLISLLDRGFVCAIAHIRGGMELGYEWYEQGKMGNKMNSFYDFIDCSEALIQQKYTAADRLFAQGGSAGGLLMGAVANLRPDLYKGIISSVPFVDVLTTMSDPSIPLTTGEYTEWGNPNNPEEYAYMKQYSPYDNIKAQAYPHLLVKTSFSDSQVQYFEPAKWVARLRDLKTDDHLLLFITNMTGSHGGASGRFERLKERALEYSWMLGLLGQN